MSVTYTATLPVGEQTVAVLTGVLDAERTRRGTRAGTRSLTSHNQAVLILRWFLDGTRMQQLGTDNTISTSTAYDYLHEGIDVLAARAPGLHCALPAAKAAGYSHVGIDGTVIETDRCTAPGPTDGVDLWWSGKHHQHGGNVQVMTVPDGRPIWTCDVRPGREHDTTAVRAHPEILPCLTETLHDLRALGDLGYEGEADTITVAFKTPAQSHPTPLQQMFNKAHNGIRAIGERGHAPAQDDTPSTAQHQPGPPAHREDRRRSPGTPPPRTPPHYLTTVSNQPPARKGSVSLPQIH